MNSQGNLVLSRMGNEDIVFIIPPSTEETIVNLSVSSIKPNQVKLTCNTPKRVNIARREIIKAR
tara:strand:- start:2775 stop:2966 length:192 start_codon:yes stop_codon:yes gene_type:complete